MMISKIIMPSIGLIAKAPTITAMVTIKFMLFLVGVG
jgi:hypothetical protein